MKAIITAAGKGTRMFPLSQTTPKLLIPVFNKPLLCNFIDILKGFVDEIVLVIDKGESGEIIKNYVLNSDFPVKFSFVIQEEPKGTAHALQMAKDMIPSGEKFIYMYGDDIYSRKDVENLMKNEYGLVGMEVNDPEKWGILHQDENGNLTEMIEKPKEYVGNLANIGVYLLDTEIFDIYPEVQESIRGEYEVTDSVTLFCKRKKVKVVKLEGHWIPLGYPWHLLGAHEKLASTLEFTNEGMIEEGVQVRGRVKVGKGSVIKSGVYIEGDVVIGENCEIGPNAYLRGTTVIGNNCKIGSACEIKNSAIFNGAKIPHLSFIGDSIIGNNVNFAVQSFTTNLRHDNENVKTMIKDQLIDTGRRKFGAVIGDNVKLGGGTIIYPGRKIAMGKTTIPGEVVQKDIV